MSDMSETDTRVLDETPLTLDQLFMDLARRDEQSVIAQASSLPTDVMLTEAAGTLVDAAAYLCLVAREHVTPGGPAARHLRDLADELTAQAAICQQAADSVAIAIRGALEG